MPSSFRPNFGNLHWFRAVLSIVLLGSLAFAAQHPAAKKAPAKVDKALRARASEFLQDHVSGAFSKAYELVAADSKERFLSMTKEPLKNPQITKIEYADDFKKAVVAASVVRIANMGAAGMRDIPAIRSDSWKVEKGKWVWYYDPARECIATLFGSLPCAPEGEKNAKAVAPKVPEKITPEAIAERMKELNRGSGFNKTSLRFVKGVAGSDEIVYHNGLPGQIRVTVGFGSNAHQGYQLEPVEPVMVDAQKDVTIKVTYSGEESAPLSMSVQMYIDPFSSTFVIPIKFDPAEQASKP